ncbi:MAG: PEP-CTERM sorting domain-containing protein [Candidatus Acidiferrales bacterium]
MKPFSGLVFAMAVLGLAVGVVQPARADSVDDPTIQAGVYSGTPPGGSVIKTETSDTFTYTDTNSSPNLVYFLNDVPNTTWTDMTIVAVAGGSTSSSHTYSNETFNSSLFAAGTTAAFGTIVPANPAGPVSGAPPVTFVDDSGGTSAGVAPGEYLVIRFNNWPTDPDSTFTFTMSTPASETAPEPSSSSLLGIGLLALFGLAGFAKRRKAGIAIA